ncbi:(2Fe-2S)-binding protein [Craterilacuibacter sinensis]|uniref:Bacterioferritin-associated ferredoxin n=1 Tax=Craterilacuibacter sinensis TaxID=2686017 RepID=A0A845BPL0_9NEIS|nr:(2Fe-2S)-binding protein [Craterilacuibacter sinensis]MXR38295.1 hypothetical protein [Craterilacuibacter sinensis]
MYVCLCFPTTERQIRQAVLNGARRLRDIRPVATQCGKCGRCAHALLKQASKALLPAPLNPPCEREQPCHNALNTAFTRETRDARRQEGDRVPQQGAQE